MTVQTLVVRLLIASGDYSGAVENAIHGIQAAGFDPLSPSPELLSRVPRCAADVDRIHDRLDEPEEEDLDGPSRDWPLTDAMMQLIAYVGYVLSDAGLSLSRLVTGPDPTHVYT